MNTFARIGSMHLQLAYESASAKDRVRYNRAAYLVAN